MTSFADFAKQVQGESANTGVRTVAPRSASSETISAKLSTPQTQKLISQASSATDPDGAKYQLAVDLTTDILGTQDTSDPLFKETLDETFAQMNPSEGTTGEQMRDENIAIKAGQGINEFNNMIGNGMDWVFDNTIGNIAGLGGEQAANTVKNWFNGRDASVVPDIIENVALAAIPYAGIPLVAGKNALQQSKNITDAVTGRDSVTNRRLDENQRAGKAGSAALTTALSALPGVGVAKAAAKRPAADIGSRIAGRLPSGEPSIKETASNLASKAGNAVKNAAAHPISTARNAYHVNNPTSENFVKIAQSIENSLGQNHPHVAAAIRDGLGLITPAAELAAGLGAAGLNGALAYQGVTGGDFGDAAMALADDFIEGRGVNPFVAMMPIGAGVASRKMLPSLRGNYQAGEVGSKLPFQAERAAGMGNLISQGASYDVNQPSFANLASNLGTQPESEDNNAK